MNPIESLRNSSSEVSEGFQSKFPIKENYDLAEDKRSFLISVAKDLGRPNYPSLHLNISKDLKKVQIDRILYEGDLQDRLSRWKVEKDKMLVMCGSICNNNMHKFVNGGGQVIIGLVLDNPVDKKDGNGFRVIENNPMAQRNEIAFSALKSASVYEKYLYDTIQGDNVLGLYGDLYYMISEVRSVQTYTIVYVVDDNIIRQATLHDFGKYGNILTVINLRVQ